MKERSGSTYVVLSGTPPGMGGRVILRLVPFFLRHPFQLLLLLECGSQRAKMGDKVLLGLIVIEIRVSLEETLRKDLGRGAVPFVCRGTSQVEAKFFCRAWVTRRIVEAICFFRSNVAV